MMVKCDSISSYFDARISKAATQTKNIRCARVAQLPSNPQKRMMKKKKKKKEKKNKIYNNMKKKKNNLKEIIRNEILFF